MDSDDDYEYYEYSDDEEAEAKEDAMECSSTKSLNTSPRQNQSTAMVKPGIQMMTAEEIRPKMMQHCKDVGVLLEIPLSAAGVLLRYFNWSNEALLEHCMNERDKVLKNSGVYYRCGNSIAPSNENHQRICQICLDDYDNNQLYAIPCGHAFCLECWHGFCKNSISEGPSCLVRKCPHVGCDEVVTEEEMQIVFKDSPALLQQFFLFQLRNFVESNPLSRWCPGRGCERVAYANSTTDMESLVGNVALCDSCATNFCFVCGEEPHAPSSCKQLAQWMKKCQSESETANWILVNTKACPKCKTRIEKNQGCNHMTCKNCRHEFCWICMSNWKSHRSCNSYENSTSDDDFAKAKRDLDCYLHHYNRFHIHQEAERFAKNQFKDVDLQLFLLKESYHEAKWWNFEFLKAAKEQLVKCRRVLKYTYIFAFYLDPEANKYRERFEYHQEMLERFTENLSEQLEVPLGRMNPTEVENCTRVIDNFITNILEYVEDGMDDY